MRIDDRRRAASVAAVERDSGRTGAEVEPDGNGLCRQSLLSAGTMAAKPFPAQHLGCAIDRMKSCSATARASSAAPASPQAASRQLREDQGQRKRTSTSS